MKAAVLTVSDRAAAGEREDASGPGLVAELEALGFDVTCRDVTPDDRAGIANRIRELAEDHALVLTTGGTGLGPRDVTPEATLDVLDRQAPGFTEEIRRRGAASFPRAILSRAVAGTVGDTLVLNLPGSPKGAVECLGFVAPTLMHGLKVLRGGIRDCKEDPAAGPGTDGAS